MCKMVGLVMESGDRWMSLELTRGCSEREERIGRRCRR